MTITVLRVQAPARASCGVPLVLRFRVPRVPRERAGERDRRDAATRGRRRAGMPHPGGPKADFSPNMFTRVSSIYAI